MSVRTLQDSESQHEDDRNMIPALNSSRRAPPRAWLWLVPAVFAVCARADEKYRPAPAPIPAILDSPAPPIVALGPGRDRMLLLQRVRHPSLVEVAAPWKGLAGLRINPLNNGPVATHRAVSLTLKTIADGRERKVILPPNSRLSLPVWSPDGTQFAFLRFGTREVELWAGEVSTGAARRVKGVVVNAAHGESFQWMPDSQHILTQTIPATREKTPPAEPKVPAGPAVQEAAGKLAPVRTFQDLLASAHDEELFRYFCTAQLAVVNVKTAAITPLGKPGIYSSFEPSPDGQHVLVSRLRRPFSYQLPASAFPRSVEVWDRTGRLEHLLANLPLAEEVPIGGVLPGPRHYHWRPTAPATLVWVEALDGGDPRKRVPHRDRVLALKAPFTADPAELAKTETRFNGLIWGQRNYVALLREYSASRRWTKTWLLNPDDPDEEPRLLWNLSSQDRYKDPGSPLLRPLPSGHRVMRVHENCIYLIGSGASPEGERPFLDRLDLKSLQTERLFQCDDLHHETVVALVADDASKVITRRESPGNPPNYFLRTLPGTNALALTAFPDPAPQLRGIRKQIVTYQRADGVPLSFTLYLPPDYKPGTRMPTVVWAYPREFSDADTAGQVSGTANRFTTFSGISHLFLLTQGYVVLDGVSMPVVGKDKTANDTFVEQVVASAKAAVDKAVELGVTDPDRIGVGGHSYGAFMTANLLAHSDLFRAGIARSGAYNRTLTPFGFQNERRTLWESPEVYLKMSPFMHADKVNEPLLLIHGQDDNNPGTFPVQSERLFQAVKGHGGVARLVLLPFESHNYEARESVEHTLAEMTAWFDKHVKNAAPRAPAATEPTPGRID
ncbi:MAG: S9 family peptidase [Verrucomicrobia bacterium]|nr:S9 family peptidase [Verrucomicrobiota bacterium]